MLWTEIAKVQKNNLSQLVDLQDMQQNTKIAEVISGHSGLTRLCSLNLKYQGIGH